MKYLLSTLILLSVQFSGYSQDVEMADAFRSDGKIYVVIAVILVILIGLFSFLFRIDSKISKIENRLKK